jgi:hypothetical protein
MLPTQDWLHDWSRLDFYSSSCDFNILVQDADKYGMLPSSKQNTDAFLSYVG